MNDIIIYINMKYVQKYQSGPGDLGIFPCAAFVEVQDERTIELKNKNIRNLN